jgi:osmoprotectant transport system substrate-binding protein
MRLLLAATALAVVLPLAGCVAAPGDEQETVVLGVGSTAEQQVLAALTVAALDRQAISVEVRRDLGGTVGLRREATNQNIDLFWDYTGAAWALGLGEEVPAADPAESWERVREADARGGFRWLEPTAVNATFALFVRADDVPPDTDATMSWLAGELSGEERSLCADKDFLLRPGGLEALAREYAIDLDQLPRRPADEDEAIEAVADGRCFAGLATASSGAARLADLVPVSDDLVLFPAFVAAPVARQGSPADSVTVVSALRPVVRSLDTVTLARVKAEHASGANLDDLAERFLDEVLAGG